ncbi:uncharacterized protein EI90DRAFT_2449077 [Cantharellus anzutake]|uniref:uncharacterized protein n=1 Tax=Cantharellus anzutake TaxID=1750568 RepID=UPI001905544C|nr:uncharacterized protein EI90DRAFT_2449077 [Cantharellus anzutake]KAF8339036.1 hypothetical protein EI90DRAFT_2449077 [Cantharellus anzutake]
MGGVRKPTVLILGAGRNIGIIAVKEFLDRGWNVVVGNRSPRWLEAEELGYRTFFIELTSSGSVMGTLDNAFFAKDLPNVIIYNGVVEQEIEAPTKYGDPLSISLSNMQICQEIGFYSMFETARWAMKSFAKIPDQKRVFMATGHADSISKARTEELGVALAKVQQRYFMDYLSQVFKDTGVQFYFPSQVLSRTQMVFPGYKLSGAGHAIAFYKLANFTTQGPWDIRFLKDGTFLEGYDIYITDCRQRPSDQTGQRLVMQQG